jgi:stage II sporulation protein M
MEKGKENGVNEMKTEKRSLSQILIGGYSSYIFTLTPIILICTFLFLFSLLIGFYLGPSQSGDSLRQIIQGFPDTSNMSDIQVFGFIFYNNVSKSFLFMVLGLLFALPPVIFLAFNGFVVGWFAFIFSRQYSLLATFIGIVPHGIIEIPAIILSMAMGMSLGYQLINKIRGRGVLSLDAKLALGFFITRIVPMLLIAALIEVKVSPALLALVIS